MIYIVDCMLPKEYFAHNLRALTVDMAVFRCYLNMKLPKLSNHLERLQRESMDSSIGKTYTGIGKPCLSSLTALVSGCGIPPSTTSPNMCKL